AQNAAIAASSIAPVICVPWRHSTCCRSLRVEYQYGDPAASATLTASLPSVVPPSIRIIVTCGTDV
ncbi:MAG: hypothetical protein II143_00230, partial [Bacteroidales bacterium]|nr:hypothetical protein [Bacteroidales bacterium]